MGGSIFIFVIIMVVIGIAVISAILHFVLGNLTHRATQEILNKNVQQGTGIPISDAAVNEKIDNTLAKRATKKFIENHPSYSEDTIKEYFRAVASNIINRTEMGSFSESVKSKISTDKKIDKMGSVQFVRANLMSCTSSRYAAIITLTNGRDQYSISVYGTLNENGFNTVDKYSIQKGVMVGF